MHTTAAIRGLTRACTQWQPQGSSPERQQRLLGLTGIQLCPAQLSRFLAGGVAVAGDDSGRMRGCASTLLSTAPGCSPPAQLGAPQLVVRLQQSWACNRGSRDSGMVAAEARPRGSNAPGACAARAQAPCKRLQRPAAARTPDLPDGNPPGAARDALAGALQRKRLLLQAHPALLVHCERNQGVALQKQKSIAKRSQG